MNYTKKQRELIIMAKALGFERFMTSIPVEQREWKCHQCKIITGEYPCPKCGRSDAMKRLCPLDHCHCSHEVMGGITYCPICGEAACPECGSHDVLQISRVTGYMQDVSGWNSGKIQELRDRHRINIGEE
jgi:hypothetical protein